MANIVGKKYTYVAIKQIINTIKGVINDRKSLLNMCSIFPEQKVPNNKTMNVSILTIIEKYKIYLVAILSKP